MFDWNELAFSSKKPLNSLKPIFIAAPREISAERFTQLVKTYLPQGNIVLGISKEPYVAGFEEQPQFKMLQLKTVQPIIDKVNKAKTKHTISPLTYNQRDLNFILQKLDIKRAVFVNGSWKQLFHTRPEYYTLATKQIPYELVSPFASEPEAIGYASKTTLPKLPTRGNFTAQQMLDIARQAATHSYDYGFQTGVSLGKPKGSTYQLLATACNTVVPFLTYAMHNGASRETNFSPMHDLNHYDTTHAEVQFMVEAQKNKLSLAGTTLFINLLPCPSCARMFTQTDIAEFVYREDHSDGYGVKMLEKAGKKVTRIVGD